MTAESNPAPTTDASGGVTEERVRAAREAWLSMDVPAEIEVDPANDDRVFDAHIRAAIVAADRARKPGYRQVTLDELTALVKEAMQDGWNDICMDSGHHPSDIKQCGRRELEFRAGQWASNVASFLMRYFRRENIGAVIPDAGK